MKAILVYHSIDRSGSTISVDPEVFLGHVRWLSSGAVRVTTIEELLSLDPGAEAVALTFDDGFANFASVAWPRLRDHGLPATVFVVTDHVGGTNGWDSGRGARIPALPLLDWDQLGRLGEEGVEVGSHTRHHPRLASLGPARLREEVEGSARRLWEKTGVRPRSFAYPYGSVSPAARQAVALVYDFGCTAELRTVRNGEARRLLPRLDAYYLRRPGRLESWGTPRFRGWLRTRALGRRLRRTITGP